MKEKNIAKIKALLLAKATIQLHPNINSLDLYSSIGNLGKNQWIFIRLSKNSRVRLTLCKHAKLILVKSNTTDFFIQDAETHEVIINHIFVERVLAHAPEQLFFLLHKQCLNGCLFCPLIDNLADSPYTWEKIESRIQENTPNNIQSVSFTTSYPVGKSQKEIVSELVDVVTKTRNLLGDGIPFGVSLKTPSIEHLISLKEAGFSEIRLNIETYNDSLAQKLMPNKSPHDILRSIEHAVKVFGKEKVSSNIIIGLGESDTDILNGVETLAKIGALSTLYPYDPVPLTKNQFSRPSAERIYNLAVERKKILEKHNLNPLVAKTMCCACAASHLYPGKDL